MTSSADDGSHASRKAGAETAASMAAGDAVTAAAARMPLTTAVCDGALLYDRVDSTNVVARRILGGMVASAGDGLPSHPGDGRIPMTMVAADGQTRGHGRLGRVWSSGAGSFMVSFAAVMPVDPLVDPTVNGWLPLAAGLSAIEAVEGSLERFGAEPTHPSCSLALKWPNDVFCDGLKLGGILVELVLPPTSAGLDGRWHRSIHDPIHEEGGVVIGVGLNLTVDGSVLPGTATSLHRHRAPLPPSDELRDSVASRLAGGLGRRLACFADDPAAAAARWRGEIVPACWTLGRRVRVHPVSGDDLIGTAESLNADASLTVRDEQGIGHVVRTGDVGVLAG